MKFTVRFGRPSFRWSFKRQLQFIGKGDVHFEQTGLLLSGDLLKFKLPFIDRFYHALIAEHATRTVPYSTILRHRRYSVWPTMLFKAVLLVFATLVGGAACLAVLNGAFDQDTRLFLVISICLFLIPAVVGLVLPLRRFHQIIFRRADGGKLSVVFSFRKWRDSEEFTTTVDELLSEIESLRTTSTASEVSAQGLGIEASTATKGRPRRLQRLLDPLAEATSWLVAGVLLSVLVVWLAETHVGSDLRRQSTILQDAWDSFLAPGRHVHGFLFPFPGAPSQLANFSIEPGKAPMASVIAFWAIACALAGAFSSSAKPPHTRGRNMNPVRRAIEAAATWMASRLERPEQLWALAKWSTIVALCLVGASMGRSVIYQHAKQIQSESDRKPQPPPYWSYYPMNPYTARRDPNAARMERVNQLIQEGIDLDQKRKHYPAQQKYEQALSVLLHDGGNLRDLIRRGPVPQTRAAQLVRDCARALHFAHGVGLIHRDIKTANVLIDRDQQAWITDFGLALFEDELAEYPREITGTPAYMSPEQIQGKNSHLDGRADLWSLGVILYELVTGKRPFQGKTFAELSDQILNRSPKPIRMTQTDVSPELESICFRALTKPIDDRYQTARDMLEALEHFLDPTIDDQATSTHSASHLSLRVVGTPYCYTPPSDCPVVSVGRQRRKLASGQQGCDFVIRCQAGQKDSLRISRKHLEIVREGMQHFIVDSSKFGTRVNGRQLSKGQRQLIRAGDLVSIAEVLTLEVLTSENAPSGHCPQQACVDGNQAEQHYVIEATLGDLTTFEPATH